MGILGCRGRRQCSFAVGEGRYLYCNMLQFRTGYIRLGKPLRNARPAPPLVDDMASLTDHYRDAFRNSPNRFTSTTELEGMPPVKVQFIALCQTVGLILVHPFSSKSKTPDALCLLVNGLESPQDKALVKSKTRFPPEVWKQLDAAKKPVALNIFHVNGRMRDPATMTILMVMANVYFAQFGTSAVDEKKSG